MPPTHPYGHSDIMLSALWSDPDPTVTGAIRASPRGAGYLFGDRHTRSFLKRNGLSLIVRSHQQIPSGYDEPFGERPLMFPLGRGGAVARVHSIFSILPNRRAASHTQDAPGWAPAAIDVTAAVVAVVVGSARATAVKRATTPRYA